MSPLRLLEHSWAKLAVSLIFGALLPLSFAPFNFWPLSILSPTVLALLLLAERDSSKKNLAKLAFVFGLGLFGTGASWVYISIHDFGGTGLVLALVMTMLFVCFLALVFAIPFALLLHRRSLSLFSLCFSFPAAWVLGEWSRSWLLTGFPWLYLGYAHIDTPLRQWAPIGGVFSLSFISIFSGLLFFYFCDAIYRLFRLNKQENRIYLKITFCFISVISFWASPHFLQNIHWTKPVDEIQSVALLQPNIELYKKWNPIYFSEIFEVLYEESGKHWDKDIQVWPEAAIPSLLSHVRIFTDDVDQKAQTTETHIFSGVLYDDDNLDQVYNSIVGLGLGNGTYFKQKLVPFGEYVPLEDQLRGLINFFDLPNSVIRPGPFRKLALSAQTTSGYKYSVAPFICYEVVYPDFVAKNTSQSSLLLTISNDAWFGASAGPLQHFEMVRMRALENQKYMLRATNTGVSGIIDEQGEILTLSEQFIRTSITGFVELREGSTLFSRTGSLPIVFLCTLIIIFNYSYRHSFFQRRLSQPTHSHEK